MNGTGGNAALYKPLELNGLTLPNRLAVAPMTRVSATDDGQATERMTRYYERFARGGFALVISEGIYTDQAYSQGYLNQPGLANEQQAKSWRNVVDAVHAADSFAFAQLMHAGALAQGNRYRSETVGPSATSPKGTQMPLYRGEGHYPLPRAMREDDIAHAIRGFARAARHAVEIAGFDGIEVHGANGYLLDQFLTTYTNLREDQWGGPVRQRIQLAVEVVKAVRKSVGAHVPVGVRISQAKVNDFEYKWPEREAAAAVVFTTLANAEVDFIHVTEFEAWKPAFDGKGPSLVELARVYAPGVRVIANGSLHDPERAVAMIQGGADLIALGRGALANPDWPSQVGQGRPLAEFDHNLLAPLAGIKDVELGVGEACLP